MKPAIIRPDLELKREIKNVSERNVIYIRLTGDYKLNDYGGTWGRLFQFIKEQQLPMGDFSPLCIYHDDPKVTPAEKLRTDVCMVMPVKVAPKSDVGFKVIPAGRYTSGTTGYSKGVMLPYRSLWSNVAYCFEMLPVKPGDHIVSMLPMGHVFGMVYDFLYGFSAGAHIYFLTRMPSPKIISQSFSEIKPRVISCVPLIVEKIIKKDILPKVDSKIGKLLLKVPIVNDKIKSLARQAAMEIFGGNFDEIIIGGAPFNAEVEAFLKKIGFPYTIAYGMTECGPIICSSRWETLKLASCGKATSRMEVRIDSPDPETHAGEIVCRGMNMMLGYYKNPEATAQIIDANGWLHTGDLGTLDEEGYVTVRGRSKNLLLTSSGQNIYPEEIESKLNNMPYVAESLIVLQHEKLVALIYPDFDDAFAHGLQQMDHQHAL